MGWASYSEDIAENAIDRALAGAVLEHRFRAAPSMAARANDEHAPPAGDPLRNRRASWRFVLSVLPAKVVPKTLVMTSPVEEAQVVRRTRDIREIHILCLAEMRPRAQFRPGL